MYHDGTLWTNQPYADITGFEYQDATETVYVEHWSNRILGTEVYAANTWGIDTTGAVGTHAILVNYESESGPSLSTDLNKSSFIENVQAGDVITVRIGLFTTITVTANQASYLNAVDFFDPDEDIRRSFGIRVDEDLTPYSTAEGRLKLAGPGIRSTPVATPPGGGDVITFNTDTSKFENSKRFVSARGDGGDLDKVKCSVSTSLGFMAREMLIQEPRTSQSSGPALMLTLAFCHRHPSSVFP